MRLSLVARAVLLLGLAASCINNSAERGVEPTWQAVDAEAFLPGTTTRSDVLRELGAPSQLVSLSNGTALYYVLERSQGTGLVLLLYNQRKDRTTYERAVFFFDADDVLTDFAFGDPE
ncbi:MAG: hypothetical protein AAGB93_21490 [Planctomycetota bacterium]